MVAEVVSPIAEKTIEKTTEVLVQQFSERAVYSAGTVGILCVAGVVCWGIVSIAKAAKKAISGIEAEAKAAPTQSAEPASTASV